MTTLDIEPSDVIRLIEQYLKENNLLNTLKCLQDEATVRLNAVDSIETFVNDIISGNWDVVLKNVRLLKLPDNKLIDLYEHVAVELIELHETRTVNWLMTKTEPMAKLKSEYPERYLHLQNLLSRPFFDHREAYRNGESKERRRDALAQELKKEVAVVPPQRLLSLIGDALKWQKHEGLLPSGSSIDIFTGKARMTHAEAEEHPNVLHKHCIKPLKTLDQDDDAAIFVCASEFSLDGQYLIVGYSTGLVEVRNSTTGRLAKDLKYQTQDNFIVTPRKCGVLSICFSTNELMAVGDIVGDISIWRLETGQLIQHFKSAHHKSIGCITFHRSGKEVLTGSHDTTVRLHGMRSNKTIREFKGHKSLVYDIAFSRDDNFILSGSSDQTVRIWNAKTAQTLSVYSSSARVHTVHLMPNFKSDIFLIGSRSNKIHLIDLEGKLRAKLTYHGELDDKATITHHDNCGDDTKSENGEDKSVQPNRLTQKESSQLEQLANFFTVCSSPKGNWIYAVDSQNIYCFNYSTKKVEKKILVHEETGNDLIGVKHHPFLNLLATYDTRGNLKLWKP